MSQRKTAMPVKNQHFTGRCEDYTYDGMGVVRYGTFCVFVKDMAYGDEGEVVITALRKDYAYGRLLKLEKAGPGRDEPVCPLSRVCGGCQLQHLSYQEQLRFKEELVRNNITRIAGINTEVSPIIGAKEPLYYRNKCQLPVGTDRNGNTVLGFYRFNSHEIIPADKCYLQSDKANRLTALIREMIEEYQLGREIRHLMIRDMKSTDEMMVVFVTWKEDVPHLKEICDRITKAQESVRSIIQSINPDQTNVVLGKREKLLYGCENIQDELCGLKFNISAHSFYQVNSRQTEVLYSKAIELADLNGSETVIDMYCGVGTIGMIASRKAGKVIGVEIVESAVRDARKNARINGITNAEFICGDARKASVDLVKQGIKADVVFVDPPRKGCDTVTLDSLVTISPEKIVYVSCNPATLARDLKYLEERGYRTVTIQPVDQFPQTYHVETVCLIKKAERTEELKQVFESENISFVTVSEQLINDYLDMINDEKNFASYIGGKAKMFTEEQERQWVRKKLEEKAIVFSMIEKKTGRFIGNIELMHPDDSQGELGIGITAEMQNRGFGSEAVRAFTEYGFSQLGLNRIYLRTNPKNARAIRVYEKCGFREYARDDSHVHMDVTGQ